MKEGRKEGKERKIKKTKLKQKGGRRNKKGEEEVGKEKECRKEGREKREKGRKREGRESARRRRRENEERRRRRREDHVWTRNLTTNHAYGFVKRSHCCCVDMD